MIHTVMRDKMRDLKREKGVVRRYIVGSFHGFIYLAQFF